MNVKVVFFGKDEEDAETWAALRPGLIVLLMRVRLKRIVEPELN